MSHYVHGHHAPPSSHAYPPAPTSAPPLQTNYPYSMQPVSDAYYAQPTSEAYQAQPADALYYSQTPSGDSYYYDQPAEYPQYQMQPLTYNNNGDPYVPPYFSPYPPSSSAYLAPHPPPQYVNVPQQYSSASPAPTFSLPSPPSGLAYHPTGPQPQLQQAVHSHQRDGSRKRYVQELDPYSYGDDARLVAPITHPPLPHYSSHPHISHPTLPPYALPPKAQGGSLEKPHYGFLDTRTVPNASHKRPRRPLNSYPGSTHLPPHDHISSIHFLPPHVQILSSQATSAAMLQPPSHARSQATSMPASSTHGFSVGSRCIVDTAETSMPALEHTTVNISPHSFPVTVTPVVTPTIPSTETLASCTFTKASSDAILNAGSVSTATTPGIISKPSVSFARGTADAVRATDTQNSDHGAESSNSNEDANNNMSSLMQPQPAGRPAHGNLDLSRITLASAVSILDQYSIRVLSSRPSFTYGKLPGLPLQFSCQASVVLPHVTVTGESGPNSTKKAARADASLRLCSRLEEMGELDVFLVDPAQPGEYTFKRGQAKRAMSALHVMRRLNVSQDNVKEEGDAEAKVEESAPDVLHSLLPTEDEQPTVKRQKIDQDSTSAASSTTSLHVEVGADLVNAIRSHLETMPNNYMLLSDLGNYLNSKSYFNVKPKPKLKTILATYPDMFILLTEPSIGVRLHHAHVRPRLTCSHPQIPDDSMDTANTSVPIITKDEMLKGIADPRVRSLLTNFVFKQDGDESKSADTTGHTNLSDQKMEWMRGTGASQATRENNISIKAEQNSIPGPDMSSQKISATALADFALPAEHMPPSLLATPWQLSPFEETWFHAHLITIPHAVSCNYQLALLTVDPLPIHRIRPIKLYTFTSKAPVVYPLTYAGRLSLTQKQVLLAQTFHTRHLSIVHRRTRTAPRWNPSQRNYLLIPVHTRLHTKAEASETDPNSIPETDLERAAAEDAMEYPEMYRPQISKLLSQPGPLSSPNDNSESEDVEDNKELAEAINEGELVPLDATPLFASESIRERILMVDRKSIEISPHHHEIPLHTVTDEKSSVLAEEESEIIHQRWKKLQALIPSHANHYIDDPDFQVDEVAVPVHRVNSHPTLICPLFFTLDTCEMHSQGMCPSRHTYAPYSGLSFSQMFVQLPDTAPNSHHDFDFHCVSCHTCILPACLIQRVIDNRVFICTEAPLDISKLSHHKLRFEEKIPGLLIDDSCMALDEFKLKNVLRTRRQGEEAIFFSLCCTVCALKVGDVVIPSSTMPLEPTSVHSRRNKILYYCRLFYINPFTGRRHLFAVPTPNHTTETAINSLEIVQRPVEAAPPLSEWRAFSVPEVQHPLTTSEIPWAMMSEKPHKLSLEDFEGDEFLLRDKVLRTPFNVTTYVGLGLSTLVVSAPFPGKKAASYAAHFAYKCGFDANGDPDHPLVDVQHFTGGGIDFAHMQQHISHSATGKQVPRTSEMCMRILPEMVEVFAQPASVFRLYQHATSILYELESSLQLDEAVYRLALPVHHSLLNHALTTANVSSTSNLERLEFLGDCLLKYFTSVCAFSALPTESESGLTRRREQVISNQSLSQAARHGGWLHYVRLRRFHPRTMVMAGLPDASREDTASLVLSSKIQADVTEALMGACFITHGDQGAKLFMTRLGVQCEETRPLLAERLISRDFHWIANKTCLIVMRSDPDPWLILPRDLNTLPSALRRWLCEEAPRLQNTINYRFRRVEWLIEACLHNSVINERVFPKLSLPPYASERLEFVGDAVIDRLNTEWLWRELSVASTPGDMTIQRQKLVSNATLARLAVKLNLHQALLYSADPLRGLIDRFVQDLSMISSTESLRSAPKVLADLLEAVFGAVLIDSGTYETVHSSWHSVVKYRWNELHTSVFIDFSAPFEPGVKAEQIVKPEMIKLELLAHIRPVAEKSVEETNSEE